MEVVGNSSRATAWVSAVALVLGITLIPLAFATHSLRAVVEDTEYVADALEPLIADPVVQQALIERASAPFEQFLSSDEIAQLVLDSLGLDVELPDLVNNVVNSLFEPIREDLIGSVKATVERVVTSEAFADQWRTMVADAHRGFRDLVTAAPATDGSSAPLDLPVTSLLRVVQKDLVDQGFTFLAEVPVPEVSVTVGTIDNVDVLQRNYRALQALDIWLAIAAVIAVGVGVWFSPRRDWAFIAVGIFGPLGIFGSLWYAQAWWAEEEELWQRVGDALLEPPFSQAIILAIAIVAVSGIGWFAELTRRRAQAIP